SRFHIMTRAVPRRAPAYRPRRRSWSCEFSIGKVAVVPPVFHPFSSSAFRVNICSHWYHEGPKPSTRIQRFTQARQPCYGTASPVVAQTTGWRGGGARRGPFSGLGP